MKKRKKLKEGSRELGKDGNQDNSYCQALARSDAGVKIGYKTARNLNPSNDDSERFRNLLRRIQVKECQQKPQFGQGIPQKSRCSGFRRQLGRKGGSSHSESRIQRNSARPKGCLYGLHCTLKRIRSLNLEL